MNLRRISETVTSCNTYVSGRSRLNSGTAFQTSLWEWLETLVDGRTTLYAFLLLSTGARKVIVSENSSWSEKFIFIWSLSRTIRNRLVHALHGNLRNNKTKRKPMVSGQRGRKLLTGFLWTMLVLWMATGIWMVEPVLCLPDIISGCFSLRSSVKLSHLVILSWALIASKDFGKCLYG